MNQAILNAMLATKAGRQLAESLLREVHAAWQDCRKSLNLAAPINDQTAERIFQIGFLAGTEFEAHQQNLNG